MSDPSPIEYATLTLDRERRLVLDMAALRRVEKRLRVERAEPNLSVFSALKEFLNAALRGETALTELAILITEGLRRDDAAITEEAVLAMLSPERLVPAIAAISRATSMNFPDAPRGGAASGRPLTGSTSGPSPASTSESLTKFSGD